MKIAVRYHTRSGNTRKLAEAAAGALGLEAQDMTAPLDGRVDVLLLGCSYYAFDIDETVKQFIAQNKGNIGRIVCFGTSAMMRSMIKPVSRVAVAAGIAVSGKEFHCRGQFRKVHKGRPNEKDLAAMAEFAKQIAAE